MPVIHHVFANRSNIGDWLSALGIQSLLRRPVREHLCDEPFVEATMAALRDAPNDDPIVIGGGGLFMDYFLPFWEQFAELAPGRTFHVWGAGLCDLKHDPSRPPRDVLAPILAAARTCIVRDELTRSYFALTSKAVPCPALAAVRMRRSGRGVLHVDNFSTAGELAYHVMDDVARAFALRTGRPFRKTNNRIEAGSRAGMEDVLQRYARSDIVVSSALHGCVIGLAMGCRIVAVSGDRKIEAFMEAAGLAEWVCDRDEVHRLERLHARIDEQPDGAAFVAEARAANRAVASTLLASTRTTEVTA